MNKTGTTLTLLIALSSAAWPMLASAQSDAPLLLGAASAPASDPASAPAPATGPRLPTPAQKRDNANAAAVPELKTERPVVPQISVPLGRKPPVPQTSASGPPPRSGAANPPGHIGDAAARCESLPGDLERASCRKRLAQAKPPP